MIEFSAGDVATGAGFNDLAICTQYQYSRKEKSLGELCRRFLSLYGSEGRSMLYLDQCTRELSVERRRIYDIINILESFQVINRQAKNAYHWKGISKIVISIQRQIVRDPIYTQHDVYCRNILNSSLKRIRPQELRMIQLIKAWIQQFRAVKQRLRWNLNKFKNLNNNNLAPMIIFTRDILHKTSQLIKLLL